MAAGLRTTADLICEVEFKNGRRYVYIPEKDMSTEIAAQLRAIADTLDQGGTIVGGPRKPLVIPEDQWPMDPRINKRMPPQPKWITNEDGDLVAAEDFWVEGLCGALKGARAKHYQHYMIFSMLGGDFPLHYKIFIPAPADAPWPTAVRGPADLGWMDGNSYKHDPSKAPDVNYQLWLKAGAPDRNVYGYYDAAGRPRDKDEWAEWAARKGKL